MKWISYLYAYIPSSWDSLPPSCSTSIGHQKVPSWIPCAIQQLLFFITNSTDRICYFASVMVWFSSRNRPLEISFLIEVQLLYSVVFVSAAQQSESATWILISSPLPWISFPFGSSQSPENSFLCATVSSHSLLETVFNLFTYKMHQSKLSRWKNKRYQS